MDILHFLWNYSGECHRTHWLKVNIGSGNGLMTSSHNLAQVYVPHGVTGPQSVNSWEDKDNVMNIINDNFSSF